MSGGSGSQLPGVLLFLSSLSALIATAISFVGIRTHLGNYRMPLLQRFTVRILVMWVYYNVNWLDIHIYLIGCQYIRSPRLYHYSPSMQHIGLTSAGIYTKWVEIYEVVIPLIILGFRHLLFFQPFGKHLISKLNTRNGNIGRISVCGEYYICTY